MANMKFVVIGKMRKSIRQNLGHTTYTAYDKCLTQHYKLQPNDTIKNIAYEKAHDCLSDLIDGLFILQTASKRKTAGIFYFRFEEADGERAPCSINS
jgi:hypothetical protein